MGPVLSSLVHLQAIELELRKTKKKLRNSQQMVLIQEQRIEQLQATLKAKQEEIKLTHLQSGKLELELKTRENEIAKLRLALNTAKTNKDYSAILTRMNVNKADKSKLEEQILGFMVQVEADQAACREVEQNIELENQRLAEIRQETQAKEKTLQIELDKLSQQRQEAANQVPVKERAHFERMTSRFDGEVLAQISQMNGRATEHSCGGCYMSIPLESVNSLLTRDEVITCPNCGRVLVLDTKPDQQPTT